MPLRRRWHLRGSVGLTQNRIARVLFYFDKNGRMVLLHGFIKKTRKTPDEDLDLAQRNKKKHERSQ
jgi:phage-related protein